MILLNHERMGKYKPVTSRGKPGLTCVHTHTWKMMKNSWAVIFTAPQCLIKHTGLLKFPCPLNFLLNSENQTTRCSVHLLLNRRWKWLGSQRGRCPALFTQPWGPCTFTYGDPKVSQDMHPGSRPWKGIWKEQERHCIRWHFSTVKLPRG